ncbi:MAG: bifunctional diguanylate cyclase/phosphodiesterase [Telluria sp.]
MRLQPTSLRGKLLALVLLATLPATVAHFAHNVERYRLSYKAEVARLDQLSRVIASHENTLVDNANHLLELADDVVAASTRDPAACDARLRELYASLPGYANIMVYSPAGDLRCGAIRPGKVNVAEREYFQRALASDAPVSSNLIYSKTTGKPSIAFARAVRERGAVAGVVVASLEVSNFTAIVRDVPLPKDAILAIVDRTGTILARRPALHAAVGTTVPRVAQLLAEAGARGFMAEITGIDQVERLVAAAPIRSENGRPFYVLLGSAKQSLTNDFVRSVLIDVAVFGSVIVFSLFIAWRLGINLLVRPIGVLTTAMNRVAAGQSGTSTGLEYSRFGEIGELARHFDAMSASLERREAEARQSQQRIEQLALHNHVSGLPNRVRLMEQLAEHCREPSRDCALVVVNLDRFHAIDQTLARADSDRVLQDVARRIAALARPGELVAHLVGDEFVVLMPAAPPAELVERARQVLRGIGEPLVVAGRPIGLSASIGIATTGDHRDPATLLRYADTAMRRAKEGRQQIEFFQRAADTAALEGWALESDLAHALERNELYLLYQPKTNLRSGRIVGVEALIRWRHPAKGVVAPNEFIPIAERSRLVVPIGAWVIEEACRQGERWRAAGLPPLNIAVNISAEQLLHGKVSATIEAALHATGFPARLLELEITEGVLLRDVDDELQRQRALDVKISLDDFGTGYSSLSYLKHLDLDCLKVDQSFTRNIASNAADRAVTEAIVSMAKAFALEVVAEGIETRQAEDVLKEMGCDQGQGYLYSPPVPPDALAQLVRAQRAPA